MKTYYVAGIPYSDELFHHGVKGQKWGVTRYANEDFKRMNKKYSRKDARIDLGFGEKGRLNTAQKAMSKRLAKSIKGATKMGLKAEKSYERGDVTKGSRQMAKAKAYLSTAKAQQMMANTYNNANSYDKKRINRAYIEQKIFGI